MLLEDTFLEKHKSLYKGKLYDLGCGERPNEKYLLQYCKTYVGVDWGDTLHNIKANIVADLNQPLPIENDVSDKIISLSVM